MERKACEDCLQSANRSFKIDFTQIQMDITFLVGVDFSICIQVPMAKFCNASTGVLLACQFDLLNVLLKYQIEQFYEICTK